MKKVYSSLDRLMINHLKNMLTNEGLECDIKNDLSGGLGGIPVNECSLEIWITKDTDYEKAKEVIEKTLSPSASTTEQWECSSCGEKHGSQYTECWKCGESRK